MIETSESPHKPPSAFRASFNTLLFKRKPVGSAAARETFVEKEVRQRHRLSKPQTKRSSTNLSLLALQHQAASQSRISLQSDPLLSPRLQTPLVGERRFSDKARPVSTVQEEDSTNVSGSREIAWTGAAMATDQGRGAGAATETDSASPLNVPKSRRPLSAMVFGSRRISNSQATGYRNFSFEEAPRSREVSSSNHSSTTQLDVVIDGAPRVLERRASFTPGAATRLHKTKSQELSAANEKPTTQLRRELSFEMGSKEELPMADKDYYYDTTRSATSPLGQLEVLDFDKDWEPPPQIERATTPADLDYHYLGGIRLGSLRVTNGRASPTVSELSQNLLHRPSALLRRDASSEYGSDIGSIKRTRTPPPSAWKKPPSREVSDNRKFSSSSLAQTQSSRDVSYGSDTSFTARRHADGEELPSPTADRTVNMAMSYMAEMGPNSPFSVQRSPSPTGSVLRTTSKTTEHEAELFDDEAVGGSQSSEVDRDTPSTSRTPSDATSRRGEPFVKYNKLRDSQVHEQLQPPRDLRGEASDSGYSSNASLLSMKEEKEKEKRGLVAQRVKAFEQPRAESAGAQLPATSEKSSQDTFTPKPFRNSVLKWRKTAPDLPTMSNFNQSKTSVAASQATSSTFSTRPKTPSKKLQKKRRTSQPGPPEEIMVTGSLPMDNSTIPPIPEHQSANLISRTQNFPELQRTFKSMHHTKDSASSVDQPFSAIEIRFPSPSPEDTEDDGLLRSNELPTSKRESFIARATRRQSVDRQQSLKRNSTGIAETDAQAIIQHFGCSANSLGKSPYDIAQAVMSLSKSPNVAREGGIAPHNINATQSDIQYLEADTLIQRNTPERRRLTMDDETASQWARSKSRSIAERDGQDSVENLKRLENERRAAFHDRDVFEVKPPRPYSMDNPMRAVTRKPIGGARPQHGTAKPPRFARPTTPEPKQWREEQWQHEGIYDVPLPPQTKCPPRRVDAEIRPWTERPERYPQPPDRPAPLPPRSPHRADSQQYYQVQTREESMDFSGTIEHDDSEDLGSPPPERFESYEEHEQYDEHESPAPLPPQHSPRPSFVESDDEIEELSIAPPPPSHSPRPQHLESEEGTEDVWAAQARAWKERRRSVGEFLGFTSNDLHYDDDDGSDNHSAYTNDAVIEEDLYPVIPPRETQTPQVMRQSYEFDDHSARNVWEPTSPHHAAAYESSVSRRTPSETFQDPASYYYPEYQQRRESARPLPKPRSRCPSGLSQAHSYASSLAEELHPEINGRPQPPPEFGRYSGGLQYAYERGKGFGGSAGTRTVSGKAEGNRKSVPLSTEFGVDLSDVPVIAEMKRL